MSTPLPILILDGGLGTTLETPPHNVRFTSHMPLWSSHLLISDPSTLCDVHRAFVDVGVDIILTATYQTSVEGFQHTDPHFTSDDAAKYMRSAIPLARDAFLNSNNSTPTKPARIALSLGPYGATMTPVATEYTGLYPPEMDSERALRNWHKRRLQIFAADSTTWNDVEFIAFETVKRADEVRAIRAAAGTVAPVHSNSTIATRKPWWITGVFPSEEVDELAVREWVRAALGQARDLDSNVHLPRPWGIGLNCTRIGNVEKIVQIMEDEVAYLASTKEEAVSGFVDEWHSIRSHRPWLVLYPDGTRNERYDPVTKEWVKKDEDKPMRAWEDVFMDVIRGVENRSNTWEGAIVGGCCRTGPWDIAALAKKVKTEKVVD